MRTKLEDLLYTIYYYHMPPEWEQEDVDRLAEKATIMCGAKKVEVYQFPNNDNFNPEESYICVWLPQIKDWRDMLKDAKSIGIIHRWTLDVKL